MAFDSNRINLTSWGKLLSMQRAPLTTTEMKQLKNVVLHTLSYRWSKRKSAAMAENVKKICRKSAENPQKFCRKSAENLQKICRFYIKCAEHLQVLQIMCRKSAAIAENVQVLQKICRKSVGIAENLQVLYKMCRKSAAIAENMQKICRYCRSRIGTIGTANVSCLNNSFIGLIKFTSGTYSSTLLFKSFFSSLMVIALRANSLIIHVKVSPLCSRCFFFISLFMPSFLLKVLSQ